MTTAVSTKQDNYWQTERSLLQCNEYMFTHQKACDVTFHFHDEEGADANIGAHKYVLISRSPVFYAMFCGEFNTNDVDIDDITNHVFSKLLRYLYTDNVELKVDDVLEVLNTSKKYVVPTLTKICTEFIVQSLDNENACFFLNHGIFFDEKQLQLQVLSYIEQNADAVFEQNDFYNLTHEALLSIVKSDQLSISEMGLIIHVLKWAENHCILQKKPVTKENKRAVLKDVWNFLNFDALTDENFVKIIKKFDVFTHEEIANMFIGRHDPVACSSGTPRAMKRGLKSVELGQEEKYSGAQLPPKETEVNIFCNKDIVIHGLRIHGAMGGAKMVVKAIDHDEHDQAMHEVSWTGTTDKDSLYYSCDFEEPLVVKGHKIKVKICRQQNMLDYQRSWLRMKMNNETNFCGVTFICVENVSLLRSIKYERLYDNILSV